MIVFAVIWVAFRYWLDFGNKQSIVFAILFGSIYYSLKELGVKTTKAKSRALGFSWTPNCGENE